MLDRWTNEVSQLHNEDVPVLIEYRVDGTVHTQIWFLNRVMTRSHNLPARIQYDHKGIVISEQYYVNGKPHRTDGPSSIEYKNGLVDRIYWSINGKTSTDHPDHYPLTKEEQIEYKLKN